MSGKCYPEEFNIEAIKQVVDRVYSVSSVAICLDVTTRCLYAWIKKYRPGTFTNKIQSDAQAEKRWVTDITYIRRLDLSGHHLKIDGVPLY